MSRIGKKPIEIPAGVDLKISDGFVVVKGPKGSLTKKWQNGISLNINDGKATLSIEDPSIADKRLWGLSRALLANMIKGVSIGFDRTLEFSGVGYKAVLKGDKVAELSFGYSHPIVVEAPAEMTFKADKNSIQIFGIDSEQIGKLAAYIRSLRKTEPYNGSGVRFKGEVIRRKAGKKAASS